MIVESEKMKFNVTEKAGITENTNFVSCTRMETKIYKRRWLQLGLFFVYNASNNMQWIQFTIVGHIISRYYGVSSSAVDWTAIIFHVACTILMLPGLYLMNRIGLRWTCLIGGIGTSIGTWIKVFSVYPDRFSLLFIGQVIVATSQIFVLSGSSQVAACWFGPKELATATAIGCFGGFAGISILFIITPMVIKNHERIEDIEDELSIFFLTVAIVCTVLAVALFFFFQNEPRLPPSEARALQKMKRKFGSNSFWSRLGKLFTNKSFFMLWNSYGINVGFMYVASTLLNPLFLAHFPNGETDAGTLGLLLSFPGNFGAIVFGMILDKTKKFKAISTFIYVCTLIGEILFAVGLIMEIKCLVFVAVVVIGIFSISYGTIGLEMSAEAAYPEPEDLSSGLLNIAPQIYGTTLTLIVGSLLRNYGDTAAHACLTAILTSGLMLSLFTKNELRRQNARAHDMQSKSDALLKTGQSEKNGTNKSIKIPD